MVNHTRAETASPTPVLIALGANIGDPVRQLHAAVERLADLVEAVSASDVFVTEPVGIRDQPDFFNLALSGLTTATVYDLLALGQSIEADLGRGPGLRNGPRPIDVDILAFGDLVLESAKLILPHPRLHERAFVLIPLAQVAPEWRHPLFGATAGDMLAALGEPGRVIRWGALP